MALPVVQKIWSISANNRITYVSLNDTMGRYLKGIVDFLLAHGYTTKGSCDGTTGAMDGVNRWNTVANASHRGANTTSANSWYVLTDGNAANICISYVGATDDLARISFSPTGAFVAAGTANQTPTATNEQIICGTATVGFSIIDSSTTLDRIWNGWVDSQSKLCRFVIVRSKSVVGLIWGVELLTSRATVAFSPAIWGFAYTPTNFVFSTSGFLATFSANARGGKSIINAVAVNAGGGAEMFQNSATVFGNLFTEAQGAIGYPMFPLSIGSATSTMQGPIGDLIDWWSCRTSNIQAGTIIGGLQWIQYGDNDNGLVWPWDSLTVPQMA